MCRLSEDTCTDRNVQEKCFCLRTVEVTCDERTWSGFKIRPLETQRRMSLFWWAAIPRTPRLLVFLFFCCWFFFLPPSLHSHAPTHEWLRNSGSQSESWNLVLLSQSTLCSPGVEAHPAKTCSDSPEHWGLRSNIHFSYISLSGILTASKNITRKWQKYYIIIVSDARFNYLVNEKKKDNQCLFDLYSGVKPLCF